MASHQQSCRRWRACLAIHNLVGAREVHSCKSPKQFDGLPEEHWESFGSFISAMESTDLVVKTEALYQLSLFLIYLAPTSKSSFTCPDAFTISIHFKNKDLLLSLKDIQVLYKKLFSELTSYTGWLFRQEAGAKESESKAFFNFCSSQCDHVHLVLFVEVLRCCIRILPLLEFNTSLSLVAVETLISVLKQLCCPTNLCRGLSAGGFDDVVERYRNQLLKTPHGFNEVQAHSYFANGHEKCGTAVPWIGLVEASIKSLEEYLSSQKKTEATASHMFGENITACSSHDAKAHTDRAQVACALLEVFMDEMLLQPGLADAFLASNVDAEPDSSSSNGFSCGRHIHMIMEAAAVHFILSFSGYNSIELLHGNFKTRHSDHHGSGMSLPAAVMLLDLSVIDAVCAPDMFLVHIINTLRRSLDNTSCLTPTPKLPGEMVLGLAASVLESAVNLYCRFWTTCSLPAHHNELQNGEHINSRSDKFWSLCGGDNKKTASVLELLFDEESCSKAEHQEGRSIHSRAGFSFVANATFLGNKTLESSYHAPQSACFHRRRDAASVYSSQEQDKILPTHTNCSSPSGFTYLVSNTALLVSVLQLMSMSLLHLVVEANKQNLRSREIRLPKGGTQEPPDGSHPCVSAELYIDNAKEVFKFCASKDRGKTLEDLKLDKQLQKLLYEVDEVIGHAFIFFVERFHLSFEQGAPKTLCQAYLDVLKSLITLFISIDQRRKTENLACDTHLCEVLHTPCPCDSTMKNIVEDENLEKLCSSGRQHNAEEFMSSILIMTKKYQRKRKHIMPTQKSSQRLNEVNLSAENHVSGGSSSLKLQEKGSLRRCKPAVQKNSSSNDGNSYIEEMIASEGKVDGECFDDLNDFIVCKEGRDYSTWMNSIYKKRKKKLQRTHWERLKAKRALVSLLMCKNQHNDL